MSSPAPSAAGASRWAWILAFALLSLYVASRMGAFSLWSAVATADGAVSLPNTFASVDHPYHVARAEILWRELASGHLLRWVGQHQGGYPVEFYPLGEAWLEVLVRALSLATLTAAGAHTIAVIVLFLLPGVAFVALAGEDGWSPAVGWLALVLHVALPGGWYSGGYTELAQWGLVTNVASAVAVLLVLPLLVRFLRSGQRWAGALAGGMAAYAVYCNPRSLIGLAAVGTGAWLAAIVSSTGAWKATTVHTTLVALIASLLAAPELIALVRFGRLYAFVRYSGYEGIADFARTSAAAVTLPVIVLGAAGAFIGMVSSPRVATRSVAATLAVYVALTVALIAAPGAGGLAPQLEPTRLMPLQRLLTLYLAAVVFWIAIRWAVSALQSLPREAVAAASGAEGVAPTPAVLRASVAATAIAIALSLVILVFQTRPIDGPAPDPASPAIPAVSLYPVVISAQPEQSDFMAAVRAGDAAGPPGTAMLVLGSALSWHQPLWAPLWTERPLFFDNWLWSWRPDHAGTPGYRSAAGNHYPDPEMTLTRDYLARHGIGVVIVTGGARHAAADSPSLDRVREGIYDTYVVRDPVTVVTFADTNAADSRATNQIIAASVDVPGAPVNVRVNWFPRWEAFASGEPAPIQRRDDGYMVVAGTPMRSADLRYAVQPVDWLARTLALAGGVLCMLLAAGQLRRRFGWERWYAPRQ